jgi:hypothetical protein
MYNYDLEFGTNMETSFGIVVILTPSNNGTFSLGYDKFAVQNTPGITIGSIDTEKYSAPYGSVLSSDEEGFLEGNIVPLAIGGAVVVAVVAGALVITRRSGGGL